MPNRRQGVTHFNTTVIKGGAAHPISIPRWTKPCNPDVPPQAYLHLICANFRQKIHQIFHSSLFILNTKSLVAPVAASTLIEHNY